VVCRVTITRRTITVQCWICTCRVGRDSDRGRAFQRTAIHPSDPDEEASAKVAETASRLAVWERREGRRRSVWDVDVPARVSPSIAFTAKARPMSCPAIQVSAGTLQHVFFLFRRP
jgi:hypothetical protein